MPSGTVTVHPTYIQASDLVTLASSIPPAYASQLDVGGCLYAFEIGEFLKIGFTQKPRQRLNTWVSLYAGIGLKLGLAVLSAPHVRARYHETELLNVFSEKTSRLGSREFVRASMANFLSELSSLSIELITEEEADRLRAVAEEKNKAFVQRTGEMFANFSPFSPKASDPGLNHVAAAPEDSMEDYAFSVLDGADVAWRYLVIKELKNKGIPLSSEKVDEICRECVHMANATRDLSPCASEILGWVAEDIG